MNSKEMADYKEVLLIAPGAIKTVTNINYNVSDATISSTIREVQNVYLREIVGTMLLDKIKMLEYNAIVGEADNIDTAENEAYKTLLTDYIKPYLAAKTQLDILVPISFDIRNIGAGNGKNDINIAQTNIQNVNYMRATYKTEACDKANRLVEFLENNKETYPELKGCPCKGKDNMMGERFVNTGLWVGRK